MTYRDLIKKLQSTMNDLGEKLTVDGDPGARTQAALERFDVELSMARLDAIADPAPLKDSSPLETDWFGAPWIGANIDLLGLDETDPRLNARYVPEWALEGLSQYKTLVGNAHAWCILRWNADRRKVGVKGTGSAAAASMSTWGVQCPFWFGAGLDIEHVDEHGNVSGRHAADFLYWLDQANKIAATLDGNRGNRFGVNRTDLSGKPGTNRLKTGPRGQAGWIGQSPSMAEVLEKYPQLKVGGSSASTT